MDTPFVYNPQRDAWKTIRGFVYQVELTVIRWLTLAKDAVLYCECGEDIDQVRQLLEADTTSQERLLEQVKVRARITLNSEEVITSLVRFRESARENPHIHIHFRFATTATPGREQNATFPRRLTGIEAWNALREGQFSNDEVQEFVGALRTLISRASCPKDLHENVFRQFQANIAAADASQIVQNLIQRCEWATGLPEPRQLRNEIQSLLLTQARVHHAKEAQQLTEVLTVYVLRLLTDKGEKRLTVEDLDRVLHDGSMSEFDRRLLTHLLRFSEQAETYLSRLSSQMDIVSQDVASLRHVPQQLNQLFQQFAGGGGHFLPLQLPLPDEPPNMPVIFSRRAELVHTYCDELSRVTWLALVGATGMGKTVVARFIATAYAPKNTVWISLRGDRVQEPASRHLELHLLRVASGPDRPDLIATYFLGALPFSQLARIVALRLGPKALLVLDELPDLLKTPPLKDSLVHLAMALEETDGKLLTTSQRDIPLSIKSHCNAPFVEKQIPLMTVEDVREVLTAAGMPVALMNDKFLSFLCGITHRHPALLLASSLYLRSIGWYLSDAQLSRLLTGDPTGEVRTETRRQVLRLLPDGQRSLLYRLSLIGSPFNAKLLKDVAAISPAIAHAMDLLLELTGPWVHKVGADQFEVSPLLHKTGADTLDMDVQKRVHSTVGYYYLRQHTLGPSQIVELITHFIAAREWAALVPVFLQLAGELTEKSRAEFFDVFAFAFSSSWPEDMPLPTRIAFRMIQIRIRSVLGQDTQQYNAEIEALIQRADTEAIVVAFGALLLTGPLNPAADALLAARRALQACRLYPQLPDRMRDSTIETRLASLLWVGLSNIKSHQDIRYILAILKEMNAAERQAAFAHEELCEAPRMFVDKCWSLELERPKEERDWQGVLLLLEEVRQVAEQPGGQPLQVPIARARAIILADYLDQPQNALEVIEGAFSEAQGYDRFLLNYTAGNISLDYSTLDAALARFSLVLENPPVAESYFYFDAMRRGAEAAARSNQWHLSRNFALRGFKYFSGEDGLYEPLEMLGELAWIHWKLDNRKKAWGAMAGIVHNLLHHQDFEDPRFREVFAKTGHALGWMASMAELGKPPLQTPDGETYTEPFPGFFSRQRPQLADFPLPPFFHILFSQLALLANGSKLYKLAQRALHQANRAAEEEGMWFLQYVNSLSLAELAAREENYKEAFRLAIPAIYVRPAIRGFKDSGFNLLTTQSSPEGFLKDLSEEQRRDAEYDLYWVVVGPALLRLFAKEAPLESYRVAIAELETLFMQPEHGLIDLEFWRDTFRDLRLAFSPLATRETLLEQIRGMSDEGLRLLPYCLALSRMPEISLSGSCGAQLVTFDFLFRALPASKLMIEDVTTFIFRYWRRVVSTEAFALRNAEGLIEAVRSIHEPTTSNVAALLLLAAEATDTRLSSELQESLTKAAQPTTAPG